MTEAEYLLEMLCCTPRELLERRLRGSRKIPPWLEGIAEKDVRLALRHYDDPAYKSKRDEQEKYL